MLLCLGCAIFGITEVPTDGVEFDVGDGGGDSPTEGSIPVAMGSNYNPPPRNDSVLAAKEDLESPLIQSPPTVLEASSTAITSQVVDLLDDPERGVTNPAKKSEIDELD